MKRYETKRAAFTLVELLVVIGIIALLISILLPSLGKARQAANAIACQSNLRQIGNMFQLYANSNRGYFPPSSWTPDPVAVNPQNSPRSENGAVAMWPDMLSLLLSKRTVTDVIGTGVMTSGPYNKYNGANASRMAADFAPVFHDRDVPALDILPRVSMYYVNFRIIPPSNAGDRGVYLNGRDASGAVRWMRPRQMGSLKRASDAMMAWCAPINIAAAGVIDINKYDSVCWDLDKQAYSAGYYYTYELRTDAPAYTATGSMAFLGEKVSLNNSSTGGNSWGTPPTRAQLIASNVDNTAAAPSSNAMRFRHLNNTSANFLFADTHVESRKLGEVYARDLCVNLAR